MLGKRAYFSSLVLIMIVGVSSWYSIRDDNTPQEPEKAYVRSRGKQIQIAQMSPQGILKYTAHAESAEQYSDGPTKLMQPILDLYDPKGGAGHPWNIRSDEAIVIDAHQRITLYGHVVISREKTDQAPPIRLLTDHVVLYADQDYAETDDPVTIEIPGTRTHMLAVGMKAYLHPERLELLSRIRSTYEQLQ
jgi:LPS export ABC transporter protein LptC